MWPPLVCSECKAEFFYDSYIDADDGLGERPICVDCYQYVVTRGLISDERVVETDYWKSVGSHYGIACIGIDLDCPWCRAPNELARGQSVRALEVARRLEFFPEDNCTDRLASPDSQGEHLQSISDQIQH